MAIGMRDQTSLKRIREDLQEDAGDDFPGDVVTELLVLYDVGKALDMNYFELENMLGEQGLEAVNVLRSTAVTIDGECEVIE